MFKLRVLLSLIFIQIVKNEMIFEEIRVCSDSSRLDFVNSCKSNNEECLKELNYINNFADYTDYYFVSNNQVYHSIDGTIYTQDCVITKKVWIPETVDRCHEPLNIPCSYQDPGTGQNKSGFYTQYDLIVIKPRRPSRVRRARKACKQIKNMFSVPSGSKRITRNGGSILFEDILTSAAPLQFVNFLYKNYGPIIGFYKEKLQNCSLYLIIKDIIFFVVCLLLSGLFFLKLKSFGCFIIKCFFKGVFLKSLNKHDERNGKNDIILLDDFLNNNPANSTNPTSTPNHTITTNSTNATNFTNTTNSTNATNATNSTSAKYSTNATNSTILADPKKDPKFSEITLSNMETNSGKIDIELKKKFCRHVIGGRGAIPSKIETLDKKIKEYLSNNNI